MNLLKYSREISKLQEFKKTFIGYYTYMELHKKHPTANQITTQMALREKVNLLSVEVANYVHRIGISTDIQSTEFAEFIGQDRHLDLFENVFDFNPELHPPVLAIDILDKTIGKYQTLQREFVRHKLFNPFYWLWEILGIPFHLFGSKGKEFEMSIYGKLIKLIVGLTGFIASLNVVLDELFGFKLLSLIKNSIF